MQHELPGNKQRDPNLCLKTLAFYARMYGHDLQGYKSKIIFNLSGAKSSGRKKKKKITLGWYQTQIHGKITDLPWLMYCVLFGYNELFPNI